MSEKRAIEEPLPLKEQETAINRLRGEAWRVSTSEPTIARKLQRRGYIPIGDDGVGHYLIFEIPDSGLTFRDLDAVLNPHQTENLPNGPTGAKNGPAKAPDVGKESPRDRAIDDDTDTSTTPQSIEPESGPKSPKGGKSSAGTPDIEDPLTGRSR